MNKQNIIIIGATSGIGKVLFEKYAADCNRIGIVGRRTHLLDELRQEHPDMTVTATADITKQDEIARAIESLRAELKDIDLALAATNLLDETDYRYTSFGSLSESLYSFNIRPRNIIIKMQIKI